MRSSWIFLSSLVLVLIGFRLITAMSFLPNFSPLPALLLCSLIYFRGYQAWLLPLGAWLLTDPLVSLIQGYPMVGGHHLSLLLGLAGAIGIGLLLRHRATPLRVMGGTAAAAILFYLLTNTVSFVLDPNYLKSAEGFLQAQWTGRPQDPMPTWVFLRNLLVANVLFTAGFLVARSRWETLGAASPAQPSVLRR